MKEEFLDRAFGTQATVYKEARILEERQTNQKVQPPLFTIFPRTIYSTSDIRSYSLFPRVLGGRTMTKST